MAAVTTIGLDVGSTSIRAVEATRTKDRPQVTNFGYALLPAGAVVGGVVKDDRAVTAALRHLWTTQGFASKSVTLGVSHQQVIVREIEVSNLPAKDMKQSLPFQVRDVLPLPVEEALLDFYPLENPGKAETVKGLLIAAPKDAVINTVRAIERAGLQVAHVDLACFAALRAAAHLAEDVEAVVDIGASGTNIVIHLDGVPQMVRSVPRGGTEITTMMATRLGLSTADAEALKCRVGLGHDDTAVDGGEGAEVVAEALRPLVNEIRSSFNYFASAHPEQRVQRLALVGGASLLPGLTDRLTDQLGVPVFLSDPLQRITDGRKSGRHDTLSRFRSAAAVSIGLTLGAA